MTRLLIVSANSNTDALKLGTEVRAIRDALSASSFKVLSEIEARPKDFIRRLVEFQPEIVYFVGHGSSEDDDGIVFSTPTGIDGVLTPLDFANILRCVPTRPKVVVLNACYASSFVDSILPYSIIVITASGAVSDEVAIEFSEAFFSALGKSVSVRQAFELARVQLKTEGADDKQYSVSFSDEAEADRVVFYAKPQLLAKFQTGKSGRPTKIGNQFQLELWLRGVDSGADSASFQICQGGFRQPFWEVRRAESASFWTDKLTCYGDIVMRVVVWTSEGGTGIETAISAALRRYYEGNESEFIAAAIREIEDN